MRIDLYLSSSSKIYSKWVTDLSIRTEKLKLPHCIAKQPQGSPETGWRKCLPLIWNLMYTHNIKVTYKVEKNLMFTVNMKTCLWGCSCECSQQALIKERFSLNLGSSIPWAGAAVFNFCVVIPLGSQIRYPAYWIFMLQ